MPETTIQDTELIRPITSPPETIAVEGMEPMSYLDLLYDSDANSEREEIELDIGIIDFAEKIYDSGEVTKYVRSDLFRKDCTKYSMANGDMQTIQHLVKYSFTGDIDREMMMRFKAWFPNIFCSNTSASLNALLALQHYFAARYREN